MHKRKISLSDETYAPRKSANMESETQDLGVLGQELNAIDLNQGPNTESEPKSKNILRKRRIDPDDHLKVDSGESLHKRTLQATSSASSDEYAKALGHEDSDSSECSPEYKTNSIKKTVEKYFRRAQTNSTGTMKNIKGKILKVFKPSSTQILSKEKKYETKMGIYREISEHSISSTESDGSENEMSRKTLIGKTKSAILSKLKTMLETSKQSKDLTLPLCSTQSSCRSINQYDNIETNTSEVRSVNEVLSHFKWFLESKTESDSIKTDDNNKDFKLSTESEIRTLGYSTKAATESLHRNLEHITKTKKSVYQDLKDNTPEITEYSLIKNAGKVRNNVSLYEVENSEFIIENNRINHRQRIVYNETHEYVRDMLLANIKDKELVLKKIIIKGRFEDDFYKQLKAIEKANKLQDEIDDLHDILDESQKMENITKSSEEVSSKSKSKNKCPEDPIKSFKYLFLHIYRYSSSEFNNRYVFERMDTLKFMTAFEEYMDSKEIHDRESKFLKKDAINAVFRLYFSLLLCRPKMTCEIEHTENGSLEDYKNYINALDKAVKENLKCFHKLVPQISFDSMISPLFSYLSDSYKKHKEILSFLCKERPDIFSRCFDANQAFFERFCQDHFKNF